MELDRSIEQPRSSGLGDAVGVGLKVAVAVGVLVGLGGTVGVGLKVAVAVGVLVGLGGAVGVSVGTGPSSTLVNTQTVVPSDESATKSGRPSPLICPCCTATRLPIDRENREKPL